jgi:hypothetical protein
MIIDGTNGLTFNNATTQASAGCVLQVVSLTSGTSTSTTSSSWVATALLASITPKFSTSKIYVNVSASVDNGSTGGQAGTTIFRGATNLAASLSNTAFNDSYNSTGRVITSVGMSILDSPATTSSTTYTVYLSSFVGGSVALSSAAGSTITLMEIAG